MNYGLSPRALIRDTAGHILILRRSTECTYWPGEWELTGGKPDPGENIFQCLMREAREETGLEVDLVRLMGAAEVDLPHIRVIYLVLEARISGGTLQISEEHLESRWVTLAELKQIKLIEPLANALRNVVLI